MAHPSLASRRAVASPMPLDPPVITATRFSAIHVLLVILGAARQLRPARRKHLPASSSATSAPRSSRPIALAMDRYGRDTAQRFAARHHREEIMAKRSPEPTVVRAEDIAPR